MGMLEQILEAQRRIEALGPAPPEIRVTEHAVQRTQARIYPKHKAKNASHLRRMNNKWRRRYGFIVKPAALLMDASALQLGMFVRQRRAPGKQILFVHPSLMPMIEAAFKPVTKLVGDL